MALCINCNIAIHTNKEYEYNVMDMSPDIVSILQEWNEQEASDEDHICEECFNLLVRELNNRTEGNIGGRQFGHSNVCVGCGVSLNRQTGRRSRPLTRESAEYTYFANLCRLPEDVCVCNACWQRAHHHLQVQREEGAQIPHPASGSSSNVDSLSRSSSDIPQFEQAGNASQNTYFDLNGKQSPKTKLPRLVPGTPSALPQRVKTLRTKLAFEDEEVEDYFQDEEVEDYVKEEAVEDYFEDAEVEDYVVVNGELLKVKQTKPTGRGRGGRGRGRGRGRGLATATPPSPEPRATTPVATSSNYEDALALRKINLKKTKKELSKLPVHLQKEYVAWKRTKELERVLLPDAPPRKRTRKESPPRVDIRLVSGTPTIPPPPKPQYWQRQRDHLRDPSPLSGDLNCPSPLPGDLNYSSPLPDDLNFASPLPSEDALESIASPLMCDWTTGQIHERREKPPGSVAAAQTGLCKPSSTITSADVGLQPKQVDVSQQSQPSCSQAVPTSQERNINGKDLGTEQTEALIAEWLDGSDGESVDIPGSDEDPPTHFAGQEPANIPEDTDRNLGQWLNDQDSTADQTVRSMLSDDNLAFDWSNDPNSFLGQREVFTGDSGPTFPILDSTRPIDVFLKFFDEDLLNLIVTESNRYAGSITPPLKEHSRLRLIKETDRKEIGTFIAILMFQSILPLSVEKDYFRENGYLTLPYFKSLMTYNRFIILKKLLHFTDNSASTSELNLDQQKLRKLGPLLDILNNKFCSLYLPSQNIAIDESLLKWQGCLTFTQKIATKAAKVGVKSYELCEASTGYLWKFIVYTGKGMTHGQIEDTDRDEGEAPPNITAKIVDDLVKPLLNRGHTLTMDNFYNSPLLTRYLKTNKTDCLGTLRINRDFVPEAIKSLSKSDMRPGEVVHSYCRDQSILLWRDKNLVSMISTYHRGEVGGKEKYGTYRYKPQAVLDYNLSMGGVDKKDQLLSAHPMERSRNTSWYKKVFRRLLNVTVLNSYIIFKTRFPKITQRQFRDQLANEMVNAFKAQPIPPRLTDVEKMVIIHKRNFERPILRGNHFIGLGNSKHMRCKWCKKGRTKYLCKQCNVTLCLKSCFEDFHTKYSNTTN